MAANPNNPNGNEGRGGALTIIWVSLFLISFAVAALNSIVYGEIGVWDKIIQSTFEQAKNAFSISIGLTGALALWMGVLKIGENGGVIDIISRWLSPLFCRLFPELPKGHPATGHIFMNLSANLLGLDNAATPLGLKAMQSMQELNKEKDKASNSMIMFLVLNTSGLTLIPVSIMVYRVQAGAASPTDVFVPILLATLASTIVGVTVTATLQRINLFCRPVLVTLGVLCLLVASIGWAFSALPRDVVNNYSSAFANLLLFSIICAFILAGWHKKINVYDSFIDGAKGGFNVAVSIIPFLVAILVAVGVFRASGAMDMLMNAIHSLFNVLGINGQAIEALPTALMKPLSGAGARGMMVDAMQTHGADSFVGRLACIFQGSTDTTFYILAVYFGSVGIKKMRHAVTCGLMADLAGIIAAIAVAYLFFG